MSVKLLTKYVIIIYALGSVHESWAPGSNNAKVDPMSKVTGCARLSLSKLKWAFLIDAELITRKNKFY